MMIFNFLELKISNYHLFKDTGIKNSNVKIPDLSFETDLSSNLMLLITIFQKT